MDAGGYNIENIGVLELADDVVLGANVIKNTLVQPLLEC